MWPRSPSGWSRARADPRSHDTDRALGRHPALNVDSVGPELIPTLLAGLTTAVGSAIAFFAHRTNTRFLAMALGFSAGVMVYVAFVLAALSGLSEPFGALIGLALLANFWSEGILRLSLAVVAGIMIFISFAVLLPAAESYGEHHPTIYALLEGMALMALSLLLL